MPSTYAHYRFGEEVRRSLGAEDQERIQRHITLFHIGLHGPDVLFYYKPLSSNEINRAGSSLHDWTGRKYFTMAVENVKSSHDPDAAKAYMQGFLCHYILDSFCHPCVKEFVDREHLVHVPIEGAFDRYLLVKDGLNPTAHRLTDHMIPRREDAEVMAPFLPPAQPEQVYACEKGFVSADRLFTCPGSFKRSVVYGAFKMIGRYDSLHGMVISPVEEPKYRGSSEALYALYQKAVEEAPAMFRQLEDFSAGRGELGKRFDHTFDWK